MGLTIIHRNGVFNAYDSISNQPLFNCGVTKEELIDELHRQAIERSNRTWLSEIAYAETHETNSRGETLTMVVRGNRAGANEARMPVRDFIGQFLTLPAETLLVREAMEMACKLRAPTSAGFQYREKDAGAEMIERLVAALLEATGNSNE